MSTEATIRAGQDLTLTCISAGGMPAATLKWKVKDETDFLTEGPNTEEGDADSRSNRTVLVHTFTVAKSYDQRVFVCTAENRAITILHERYNSYDDPLTCETTRLTVVGKYS